MSRVAFLGGGSFGTALAILLANKGNDVSIYDRDIDVVNDINSGKNDKYIKGLKIPKNVIAYNDQNDALKGCEYLVLAVPSHIIRMVSNSLKGRIPESVPVICIANGIPTTVLTTSHNMKYAEEVQDLFMTKEFRVYTNDDIIGVEIGGAVKNVIALASGVCDGIGYGDNTKAALMTRGMAEIVRVGLKLGGKIETFLGLTGMGDLIVTCTSVHSRNRKAGYLIGTGKTMEEAVEETGMVVEGIKACKAFYELKEELGIEMPITDALYQVLFNGKNAK